MIYVALLRGINVGGNNKVDMKKLKLVFENLGFESVITYINSGNIIFVTKEKSKVMLVDLLEKAIEKNFNVSIKVVLRDFEDIQEVIKHIPESWENNKNMKSDILFLWESIDDISVLEKLKIKPEYDDVRYISGAVLWKVDAEHITKSGKMKLVGSQVYKHMTIRNVNTTRKIFEIMQSVKEKG